MSKSFCHVCFNVLDNCKNLSDSYGEICVWCNCCGRIDKKTMWNARYETYKRQLQENVTHINKVGFLSEIQQGNVIENLSYYKKILKECLKHLTFTEPKCPVCNKDYTLYETDNLIKCSTCDWEKPKEA